MATDKNHEAARHGTAGYDSVNRGFTFLHHTQESKALVDSAAIRIDVDLYWAGNIINIIDGVKLLQIVITLVDIDDGLGKLIHRLLINLFG